MKSWAIEFLDGDETKWKKVIDYALPMTTHVEFNILYNDENLEEFLKRYENSIDDIIRKKQKLYSSGRVIRLKKTQQVENLIKEIGFNRFKNWFIEDPSFYIQEVEIVATISHEDQIYLNPSYIDLAHFSDFSLEHALFEDEDIGLWDRIKNFFSSKELK